MRSVRASLGAIVLGFEFVVIFLGSLVIYGLKAFAGWGWPDWSALVVGGGVLLLTVVAIATVRWPFGRALGLGVQIIVTLGGLV
ncbi:MAG TPA: DUF4233 domain-containing protein, partial [Microbacteriaceae bacterium]|nr:DUF4233 domain-containing protein [Microbacteriaceae bacterium]